MADSSPPASNRSLTGQLILCAVAMFAFGFVLLPPLYRVFCDITGFGGRGNDSPMVVAEAPDLSRRIRIEFVATVNNYGPWQFEPTVESMTVNPGQMYYATFNAINLSDEARTGQAVPSIAPVVASQHFQKIECFCFVSQEFTGKESRALPLQFIVSPDLPEYVDTITLSYTYFESNYVTRR
ncbi:MAG: cytochrome c oxidase assembly protein [Proteobacteria bacterium]|nr:cytochrome c oxidase assembly protein [Pseudomonadota bacterium]